MKPKSAKGKARRLQNRIRAMIFARFPALKPADVRCSIMGESGRDLHFSPVAQAMVPLAIEAKNVERLNVWSAIAQAEHHAKKYGGVPTVVLSRNHLPEPYCAIPLAYLLNLLATHPNVGVLACQDETPSSSVRPSTPS